MKKINNLFWFSFLIIYLELVYIYFVFNTIFSVDTLCVIILSIPYGILLSFICGLFNKKINKILTILLTFIFTFIFVTQIVYYNFYDSIISFFSLLSGTAQVLGFFGAVWDVIVRIWYILVILFVPFLLYLFINKKLISYNKTSKTNLVLLTTFLLFSLLSISLISFDNKTYYSKNNLYYNTHAPLMSVKKMGLLTAQLIDIKRYFFGFEEKLEVKDKKEIDLNIEEYNVLDIDFDELITNESDETIKQMHIYFENLEATKKNEYTGIFQNKNLIFITAESFYAPAVDENLTPTLYKMLNNGIVFNNFYQPLYPISTSDGEYMNLTSLLPKEGTWSLYESSNNYMPFGLGNILKASGYVANAYHDNRYDFYNRQLSHTNLGFNYEGCGNGLEKLMNCDVWTESDYEMIESTYGDYINEEKFVTYYMTVSGHMRYTQDTNYIVQKQYDLVKNFDYSESVKGYYATMIELDSALKSIMLHLEENNKLDDTVIVIVPDHYPYGLTIEELNEISNKKISTNTDTYKNGLIIYNSNIKKIEVNKIVSSIDIIPTLYNLFGITYDSRLLMGTDALSDTEGLLILSNRSWISEKGEYNSITNKFVPKIEEKVDSQYADLINNKVYKKFSISSLIIDKDYYNKLDLK